MWGGGVVGGLGWYESGVVFMHREGGLSDSLRGWDRVSREPLLFEMRRIIDFGSVGCCESAALAGWNHKFSISCLIVGKDIK